MDLPPMKSGTGPNAARAASMAPRQHPSSTSALSGTLRRAAMYGKSKVAAEMPRSTMPRANRVMNGLDCPAPAPCASTNAARGEALE
jgi:hypothetical protein